MNGRATNSMGLERSLIQVDISTKGTLRILNSMARVEYNGQMVAAMMEITMKVKSMVKVHLCGRVENNTLEVGSMVNSMGREL